MFSGIRSAGDFNVRELDVIHAHFIPFEYVSDCKQSVADLKHQRVGGAYPVIACSCGRLKIQDGVLPFFRILVRRRVKWNLL